MPIENADRPERKMIVRSVKSEVNRLKRSTGISESQALTLVHCFGANRAMMQRAALKLAALKRSH